MAAENGGVVTALTDRVIRPTGSQTAKKIGNDMPGGQNTKRAKMTLQKMEAAQNAPKTDNALKISQAINAARVNRAKNVQAHLTAANVAKTNNVANVVVC